MSLGELYERLVIRLYGKPDQVVRQDVRDATHELSNEVTKLRANLRRIADAKDPVEELTRTMRGAHD